MKTEGPRPEVQAEPWGGYVWRSGGAHGWEETLPGAMRQAEDAARGPAS